MVAICGLDNPSAEFVADASTVINLISTGYAAEIAEALPNRIVVVDVVRAELDFGRARGRSHPDRLDELIDRGFIGTVQLGDAASRHFEDLVIGSAVDTLDDGEAATIAYAVESGGVALIDERKATRICNQRFSALRVVSTLDLLRQPIVENTLGSGRLVEAVFGALQHGRMRVLPNHVEYVLDLIGPERASLCPSLPKRARASA